MAQPHFDPGYDSGGHDDDRGGKPTNRKSSHVIIPKNDVGYPYRRKNTWNTGSLKISITKISGKWKTEMISIVVMVALKPVPQFKKKKIVQEMASFGSANILNNITDI